MRDRLETLRAAQKAHDDFVNRLFHEKGSNRVVCSGEQWDCMTSAMSAEKAARIALIPDEQEAIRLLHDCYIRLKELGWNNPVYCPKDGSAFDIIELGSTGIHKCVYQGEWPTGSWWIVEPGDMSPTRPAMYRVTEAELAKRAKFRDLASAHLTQSEGE